MAVAGQGTKNLIDLARALIAVCDNVAENQADDLKHLLIRAKAALEKRNRFAHSMRGSAADGSLVTLSSRFQKWELLIEPATASELSDLNHELIALSAGLIGWTTSTLPTGFSNEVQLRWEKYVHELPHEEREALIAGRARQLIVEGSVADPEAEPSSSPEGTE